MKLNAKNNDYFLRLFKSRPIRRLNSVQNGHSGRFWVYTGVSRNPPKTCELGILNTVFIMWRKLHFSLKCPIFEHIRFSVVFSFLNWSRAFASNCSTFNMFEIFEMPSFFQFQEYEVEIGHFKFLDRIPTVKSKISGKVFLKSESRTSLTFKL